MTKQEKEFKKLVNNYDEKFDTNVMDWYSYYGFNEFYDILKKANGREIVFTNDLISEKFDGIKYKYIQP